MSLGPMIVRELRVEARHVINYWARVLSAATAMLVFDLLLRGQRAFSTPADLGAQLFVDLSTVTFAVLVLLVPLFTADCLSREKREGTLGLLFLTPLTAREVVNSKCLVHGLRGLVVCLAILPVICIPMMLGGVTWRSLLLSLLGDASVLLLALGSGVLASAWAEQRARALILAEVTGLLALFASGILLFWAFVSQVAFPYLPGIASQRLPASVWVFGGLGLYSGRAMPSLLNLLSGSGFWACVMVYAGLAVFSLLYCWVVIWLAARRIGKTWQEEPPSPRQLWWGRTFCTPLFWRGLFRRKLGRLRERNPVAWLYRHSWSHRLIEWGWGLVVVVGQFAPTPFTNDWEPLLHWHVYLLLGVVTGLAFSAARSFDDERQNGAMELLLVTPLRAAQVINGRLQALWHQFYPAFGILLGIWITGYAVDEGAYYRFYDHEVGGPFWVLYWGQITSVFLAAPVVGLALSLEGIPWAINWLLTLVVTLIWPYMVGIGLLAAASLVIDVRPLFPGGSPLQGWMSLWPVTACRLAMAVVAWWFAVHNLERRRFIKGWRKSRGQQFQTMAKRLSSIGGVPPTVNG
jgi:ABC-type transport system involved in multi-copper enzyme maturation permease subunit